MGPLESLNIISPELGLILALLVGMGFGFVLEQAGFSSSKKLAGLFYGYDFVVLRVFFTAAITAMLGTILLAYIGVLDLSLIFINPNYSWSALVGGVIMGLGFIIGGFCPGTSLCAVSIGKIDAIVFVIGLFIGSFIFAEGYPLFKGIYSAGYFGDSLIYETLGLSKGVFVLLLVSIAISAFVATYFVELHVNNEKMPKFSEILSKYPFHLTGIALILIITLWVSTLPTREERITMNSTSYSTDLKNKTSEISSIELVYNIIDGKKSFVVIDVRPDSLYQKLSIPGSLNIPVNEIFNREWEDIMDNASLEKIFVGTNEQESRLAYFVARELGYSNLFVLSGGVQRFEQVFIKGDFSTIKQESNVAFVKKARPILDSIIEKSKKPKLKPKVLTKAKGGCG